MLVNQCGHPDREPFGRICDHLLDSKQAGHNKRFTGVAQTYDLICGPCSRELEKVDAALISVCNDCFRLIEDSGSWDGIVGKPEVLSLPSTLRFVHEDIPLPQLAEFQIVEVQPIESLEGTWLACSSTGLLIEIVPAQNAVRFVTQMPHNALDFDGPNIRGSQHEWAKGSPCVLRVSRNGELAAISNRYGQKGLVLEVATGKATMSLERDDYHEDVSSFPLAFINLNDRLLVIHGTAWNRLDVSDARTGILLTKRGPTSYNRGEARPEHYLDYFHCSLLISPGQQYVADNGWSWHPIGSVETWNVRQWLDNNVWESEDGDSKKCLCWRGYFWDGPLCWIDDCHLAVWGYGQEDTELFPAACIFDVRSGKLERWFAGPKGSMVYDDYLFCFDKENGMSIWDVETGERLLSEPGFCPIGYHRTAKQFLTVMEDGMVRISHLVRG